MTLSYEPILKLRAGLTVLALGPHADDIELGCGATLLYLKDALKAKIHYLVFCDHFRQRADRPLINRKQEINKSARMLRANTFDCLGYPDTRFGDVARAIQDYVEDSCRVRKPDLVLAPRLDDNHQDHVVVAEAAAREAPYHARALWHYEVKQAAQRHEFEPNVFIDVSRKCRRPLWNKKAEEAYRAFLTDLKVRGDTYAHRKVFLLRHCMVSQLKKPFLHPELILGSLRYRGMQASPLTAYAEAFKARVAL